MVIPEEMVKDGHAHTEEIFCRQVLREDASVFSSQWMSIPLRHAGTVTPESLLERYLVHVRRCTLSLVRPVRSRERIEFRLVATRTGLLSFVPPFSEGQGEVRSVTLRITGGLLVQPGERGRGELSFVAEKLGEGVKVTVRLSGFFPRLLGSKSPSRLRKLFYRLTQAFIHKLVTVRFLARLYRELKGKGIPVRVVRVRGGDEEEI